MPSVLKPVSMFNWTARNDQPYGSLQNQVLDLIVPNNGVVCPLLVLEHGGGWEGGNEADGGVVTIAMQLAMKGWAVASIRYRLSGQATWPAQVVDTCAAIRELRAKASLWRLWPDKIGGFGFSAGGHLIAHAAIAGPDPDYRQGRNLTQSHQLQAALCDYPPTSLTEWVNTPGYTSLQASTSIVSRLLGAPVLTVPAKADDASPAKRVAEFADTAPPLWLRHGTADSTVPVQQSQLLHDAYVAAGIGDRVTLEEKPYANHGTPTGDFYSSAHITAISNWFRDRLLA